MMARVAVALAALVLVGSAPGSAAQTDAVAPSADIQAQVEAHRAELDAVTRDIALSQAREAELRKEIDALDRDRSSLTKALIDAGAEVKRLEGALDASERRLSALLADEEKLRASLAGRREVLADVLAALQRMGDHPPPALLVRPEDALAAVRSAILLGAVVPNVRNAADQLAADLNKLVALRGDQEHERDRLKADATVPGGGPHAHCAAPRGQAAPERDRYGGADRGAEADRRSRGARPPPSATSWRGWSRPSPLHRLRPTTTASVRPRSLGTADRLAPAVAFTDARGLLPLPANGRVLTAYGAPNGLGGKAQGISLATRAGAEIVAPADGTVAYAGEFRSYGQLLIINAGGGYHVVLAGMERIDVQLGQFVLAGEPVAAMASQRLASVGATLVGTTEPVLYVEFRKDGASIDPAPWWAASNPEKVGG